MCSKKDPDVRRKQLLDALLPQLLRFFSSSAGVLKNVLSSEHGNQVLFETMQNAEPGSSVTL